MRNYYNEYYSIFNILKEFIEKLDIINSNYICKTKNNYTRPIIKEQESSFLEALGL
jgi:CTP:phosphocholine cytidylyltransferase-like protein